MNRTVDNKQSSQGRQRPHFTIYSITALILFGVAITLFLRPNSAGTPGLMNAITNGLLNPFVFALWCIGSGVYIWWRKPQWEMFAIATTPVLLYAIFAAMVVVPNPTSPLTPIVLHGGLFVLLVRFAWGRDRERDGRRE